MEFWYRPERSRQGAVVVFAAFLLVVLIAIAAFAVDLGRLVLVRTQLQAAADAAAMAAAAYKGGSEADATALAQQFAARHIAGGKPIELDAFDVQFGVWEATERTFTATGSFGNAVRVTTRRDSATNGQPDFLFARLFGNDSFAIRASAVAMANPRDIAFVIDLSGSMNDDTEPVWATGAINQKFSAAGYENIGDSLVQKLFDDFGFGAFPGQVQYIGESLGVPRNKDAYAEMTKDGGPLTLLTVPLPYRITALDAEPVRKIKAYRWMIDHQIAVAMPAAQPAADSLTQYGYWEKYLDYIIRSRKVIPPSPPSPRSPPKPPSTPRPPSPPGTPPPTPSPPKPPPIGLRFPHGPGDWFAVWQASERGRRRSDSGRLQPMSHESFASAQSGIWAITAADLLMASPGTPPANRGWLPPNQDPDRIHKFNNPNQATFPEVRSNAPKQWRNKIGYVTYVQFMLDHGRDLRPEGSTYTPISQHSPNCPYHSEETAGGTFRFPPRSQPMHASRRALIAAMAVVDDRNSLIPDPNQRDWVSVISFDSLSNGGAKIRQPLTGDYKEAMRACTELQSVGDKGGSTATETGLIAARSHLQPEEAGGQGRKSTNKIVVLLTDGVPNQYTSDPATIEQYMSANPSSNFYHDGSYWYDAPLMQAMMMQSENWNIFPVGVGLGTDYGFMDRLARMGASADGNGESPRGSGNPAEYEERLTEIFLRIINSPKVRLVE